MFIRVFSSRWKSGMEMNVVQGCSVEDPGGVEGRSMVKRRDKSDKALPQNHSSRCNGCYTSCTLSVTLVELL